MQGIRNYNLWPSLLITGMCTVALPPPPPLSHLGTLHPERPSQMTKKLSVTQRLDKRPEFPGFENLRPRVKLPSAHLDSKEAKKAASPPSVKAADVKGATPPNVEVADVKGAGQQITKATDPSAKDKDGVEIKKVKNGWLMPDMGELENLYDGH